MRGGALRLPGGGTWTVVGPGSLFQKYHCSGPRKDREPQESEDVLGLGRNRARPEHSLLCLSIIWAAPREADSPASPLGSWGRPQGVIPSPMILAGSQEWDRLSRTAPLTPAPD